jgi:hypothetical protein
LVASGGDPCNSHFPDETLTVPMIWSFKCPASVSAAVCPIDNNYLIDYFADLVVKVGDLCPSITEVNDLETSISLFRAPTQGTAPDSWAVAHDFVQNSTVFVQFGVCSAQLAPMNLTVTSVQALASGASSYEDVPVWEQLDGDLDMTLAEIQCSSASRKGVAAVISFPLSSDFFTAPTDSSLAYTIRVAANVQYTGTVSTSTFSLDLMAIDSNTHSVTLMDTSSSTVKTTPQVAVTSMKVIESGSKTTTTTPSTSDDGFEVAGLSGTSLYVAIAVVAVVAVMLVTVVALLVRVSGKRKAAAVTTTAPVEAQTADVEMATAEAEAVVAETAEAASEPEAVTVSP